jgi:hypothetical protein
VATGTGAGQHIAEPFGGQQCIELNDLHRLPLTRQPTGEQLAITQGQGFGEPEPLAEERQPRSTPSASRHGSKLAISTNCLREISP